MKAAAEYITPVILELGGKWYENYGNLCEVQFPHIVDLYLLTGLFLADMCTHAHYVLYNQAYFAGLIFVVRRSSMKNVKIGPLEISHYMVIIVL